jgi:TolB-like protein/Tfp pilus assembly protein PilF
LINKDADKRYQSITEFLTDLKSVENLITSGGEVIQHKTKRIRKTMFSKRWVFLYTVIAFLLIFFVLIIYWKLSDKSDQIHLPIKEKSVAVLPFDPISKAEENVIFTDGIHDEIITQLAKISDLKVIARTSVMVYRNSGKRISEIAKELGVESILEGSVRKHGNRIRLVAQLVDGETESHLWAETYDRDYKDIFFIQSEIAIQIATALKANLTENEKELIEEKPTENMEAYDYYLKGNYYWETSEDLKGNLKALELYDKATDLDTSFGLAYARKSIVIMAILTGWNYEKEVNQDKLGENLAKTIEIIPHNPNTYLVQGIYEYYISNNKEKALINYKKALSLKPGGAELFYWIGEFYRIERQHDKAIDYFKKGFEINPHYDHIANALGWTYLQMCEWNEAEKWCNRYLQLHPQSYSAYKLKSYIYAHGYGKLDESINILNEGIYHVDNVEGRANILEQKMFVLFNKRDYAGAIYILKSDSISYDRYWEAYFLDYWGKQEKAFSMYDSLILLYQDDIIKNPKDARIMSRLGFMYARMGEKNKALIFGRKALEIEPLLGDTYYQGINRLLMLVFILINVGEYEEACNHLERLFNISWSVSIPRLKFAPSFDPIREQSCFQELLKKYE